MNAHHMHMCNWPSVFCILTLSYFSPFVKDDIIWPCILVRIDLFFFFISSKTLVTCFLISTLLSRFIARREKWLHIILRNISRSHQSAAEINLNMSPMGCRAFKHASWKAFTDSFFWLHGKIFPVHICKGFLMIWGMWILCGTGAPKPFPPPWRIRNVTPSKGQKPFSVTHCNSAL